MSPPVPPAHASDDPVVLHLLFAELGEHLRATELKHLQVSIGYMGLLSLALSILAQNSVASNWVEAMSTLPQLIAYGVLICVGCITAFMQDAYRGWKKHYITILYFVGRAMRVEDRFFPYWLRHSPYEKIFAIRVGTDNLLTYFTYLTTTILLLIFNAILISLIETRLIAMVLVSANVSVYIAFLIFARMRVRDRVRKTNEEFEWIFHERFEDSM